MSAATPAQPFAAPPPGASNSETLGVAAGSPTTAAPSAPPCTVERCERCARCEGGRCELGEGCNGTARIVRQGAGDPLPALESLGDALRALVSDDLRVQQPELPDWAADALVLLAEAADHARMVRDGRIAQLEEALGEANVRLVEEVADHGSTEVMLSAALEGAASYAMEYALVKDAQGIPRTGYEA